MKLPVVLSVSFTEMDSVVAVAGVPEKLTVAPFTLAASVPLTGVSAEVIEMERLLLPPVPAMVPG